MAQLLFRDFHTANPRTAITATATVAITRFADSSDSGPLLFRWSLGCDICELFDWLEEEDGSSSTLTGKIALSDFICVCACVRTQCKSLPQEMKVNPFFTNSAMRSVPNKKIPNIFEFRRAALTTIRCHYTYVSCFTFTQWAQWYYITHFCQ